MLSVKSNRYSQNTSKYYYNYNNLIVRFQLQYNIMESL